MLGLRQLTVSFSDLEPGSQPKYEWTSSTSRCLPRSFRLRLWANVARLVGAASAARAKPDAFSL